MPVALRQHDPIEETYGLSAIPRPLPDGRRGLVVYVPPMNPHPEVSRRFRDRLLEDLGPQWELRYWNHGKRPWSRGAVTDTVRQLMGQVAGWRQAAVDEGHPITDILLVGHSLGGILARDAWLTARAEMDSPVGEAGADWAAAVRRIVLLGAPNAGIDPRRLPWLGRLGFALLAPFLPMYAEDLRRGSPYITGLRIRWVSRFRDAPQDLPGVVQVLGGRDRLVRDDDSRDVLYMAGSVLVRVASAHHGDLPGVCASDEWYPTARRAVMGDISGEQTAAAAQSTRRAVMLLHGIRAGNYRSWVSDLSGVIADRPDAPVIRTPSYGYLSAIGFALPFVRKAQARRFLDWYSELHVTHRPELIAIAAHSNGTFIVGRALLEVPSMCFQAIYLAGSVLPRTYPWGTVFRRGQVLGAGTAGAAGAVHSDRGRSDIPVGVLCALLRGAGQRKLGTAGFDGFDASVDGLVQDAAWFPGGHGAALSTSARHTWVAEFLEGNAPACEQGGVPPNAPAGWLRYLSRIAAALAPGIAVLAVLGLGWFLATGVFVARLVALLVVAYLVWALASSV